MDKIKLGSDLATVNGLSVVNDLDGNTTLILNALIVLGRLVIEVIQNRRKRKKENEQKQKEGEEV